MLCSRKETNKMKLFKKYEIIGQEVYIAQLGH